MASRSMKRGLTNGVQRKTIVFRFFPNGSSTSALTLRDPDGFVASVIRSATAGKFTVTMRDAYYRVINITPTVQLAGDTTDLTAQWGTVSNEGTSTALSFVVRLLAGATNTDMASDPNNSVGITLEVEDSAAARV